MARHTFFSFDYRHIWKVNQIRNIPQVTSSAAAGFKDSSLWEKSKSQSDTKIKQMIDKALEHTSVTVVCVTHGTADRKFINYEIDESLKRGNGLVAIQIHRLKDPNNSNHAVGKTPEQIEKNGFKVYQYTDGENLAKHIEEAAKIAGR